MEGNGVKSEPRMGGGGGEGGIKDIGKRIMDWID